MKNMKGVLLVFLMLYCNDYKAAAQSGTGAAGGDGSGTGGSVSYTIGLTSYSNAATSSALVTEGIQQPYEIFILGSLPTHFKASVFHNPTNDYVILNVENNPLQNLSYALVDITGKVISTKSIIENQTQIPMKSLHSSTYFLNLLMGGKKAKSFQIIKN
jgi:hypothetical protein